VRACRTSSPKKGHNILQKLTAGESITRHEINEFRQTCYNCQTSQGRKVVDSPSHQADAAEILERILDVLDFHGGSYQLTTSRQPVGSSYTIVPGLDPTGYSSLSVLAKGHIEKSSPTLEVAAFAHMGRSVPLQTLIDDTWADEIISNVKVADKDKDGSPCVKQFEAMRLQKKVGLQTAFPELIRITVKQLEDAKSTMTRTDEVYPFGSGNGPKYRLQAIIEHRPGHYVAHARRDNGEFIEANDSWVHASQQEITGFAYYYLKE